MTLGRMYYIRGYIIHVNLSLYSIMNRLDDMGVSCQ